MENVLTIEEIEKLLEEEIEQELPTKEIKVEKFDTIRNVKKMKFKEIIYHTFYKDGKYTEEPSDVFLFLENNKDYIGFHCYFCYKYEEYENIVIIKDLECSDINKYNRFDFNVLKKDLISYIKDFNKKWNKKYSKILIMLDEDCIKVDEREILIYDA